MACETSMNVAVVVLVGTLVGYCSCSSGVQYAVGDSPWTIPPYPSYFSNWSSSHFFKIGDSLVFDFETGRYDVIQVSRQDYEMCTVWNPIRIFYGGPAIIPLTDAGVLYFVCNFSNYCSLGLKISVSVHRQLPSSPSPAPTSHPPLTLPPPPPSLAGPAPPNGNDAPHSTNKKSSATAARSGVWFGLLLVGLFPSFLAAVLV